jgi:hypothetical protein
MKIFQNSILRARLACEIVLLAILTMPLSACKKFIGVDTPSTAVSTESAFKSDQTAAAVLTGIYSGLYVQFNTPDLYGASLYTELSADNLELFDKDANLLFRDFYLHELTDASYYYWGCTYNVIYVCNNAIEELQASKSLTPTVRNRLLGEAYFMRAFCYFYLVNLYGDVPLAVTSQYKVTSILSRSSVRDIYQVIDRDLSEAAKLVTNTYVDADVSKTTSERLRPNLSAVYALQARVFLFQKKYTEAEKAATEVINQTALYNLTSPESSFMMNSSETIWALQPVSLGYNTWEAAVFLLPAEGPSIGKVLYASENLVKKFEPGDLRKDKWLGNVTVGSGSDEKTYYYPTKYKTAPDPGSTNITEYPIALRLSEQFLIRAEARNEQGNVTGAIEDLNTLRAKRRAEPTVSVPNPLPPLSSLMTKDALIAIILKERQTELFTEWGHRWLDLKRTGKVDEVMKAVSEARGSIWSSYMALYPLPARDIKLNPNLSQNPGYTK